MFSYKRSDRVGEAIQHEISQIVQELKEQELGFITITGVKLTDDLKSAVIFFSVIGSEEEIKKNRELIKKHTPNIRHQLAQRMKLRRVPEIVFEYDITPAKAGRVFELLEQVHKEENENPKPE